MTPERRALRDAWLAEMWPTCREVPGVWRDEKRAADRRQQRALEEMAAEAETLHTGLPTGRARNGGDR